MALQIIEGLITRGRLAGECDDNELTKIACTNLTLSGSTGDTSCTVSSPEYSFSVSSSLQGDANTSSVFTWVKKLGSTYYALHNGSSGKSKQSSTGEGSWTDTVSGQFRAHPSYGEPIYNLDNDELVWVNFALRTFDGSTVGTISTGKESEGLEFIFRDDTYYYLGTDDGIYRATTLGNTWTNVYSETDSFNSSTYPGFVSNGNTRIIYSRTGNNESIILRSTDSGATWTSTDETNNVVHIAYNSDDNYWIKLYYDSYQEAYYQISTDDGASWGTAIGLTTSGLGANQLSQPRDMVYGGNGKWYFTFEPSTTTYKGLYSGTNIKTTSDGTDQSLTEEIAITNTQIYQGLRLSIDQYNVNEFFMSYVTGGTSSTPETTIWKFDAS